MFLNKSTFFFLLAALCPIAAAAAEPSTEKSTGTTFTAEFSLWEAGVVGGGGYLPDYPASDQNHLKGIGAPYVIYRGKIVRADREGARARLLKARVYEVDLSLAASFASDSKDNRAREGMPDIDYMLELGPRLSFEMSDFGGRGKLRLFIPVRAVFSTDFSNFIHRGFTLTPALNARWRLGKNPSRLLISQLTSSFGNRQLNAYFYDVAPAFVRPDRPFYDARGGYIGTDLFTGILFPIRQWLRIFTGVQVLLHSASANETSPLFKRHVNYSLAGGLIWAFYTSRRPAAYLE